MWLLTADEQYTVESNEAYPQFMYYDTEVPMLMTFDGGEEDNSGNEGEGTVTPNPDENEGTENGGNGENADTENNNDNNTNNENNEENNGSQNAPNEEIPNTNSSYYFIPFVFVAVVALAVSMLVIFKHRRIEE